MAGNKITHEEYTCISFQHKDAIDTIGYVAGVYTRSLDYTLSSPETSCRPEALNAPRSSLRNRVIMERDPEGLIRLTIKRITPEDAGQYTLKVWNDYGEAICHGKLICESKCSL